MSSWIKCSDKLPAYNEKVLACFVNALERKTVAAAELCHEKRCASPESHDYDDVWYVHPGWGHKIKPTHWQPLPAPPTD
ncbi:MULTISPECIES: DUF551 domain-containing protein [unclassified Pseudomonas]|uniref:DUF551 domain-containing protein n=1 Tax=unclassified Pseudomonas TaxID=196821 RepID=UPI000A1EC9B8|nr:MULTISPECIES: DUF551 domain-containing protein [unclassified Pseudomonas]